VQEKSRHSIFITAGQYLDKREFLYMYKIEYIHLNLFISDYVIGYAL